MDKICILPWIHLEAQTDGVVKPCCQFEGAVGDLNVQSLDEVWTSSEMDSVRKTFLNGGFPEGCIKCKLSEESGNLSKRQSDNIKFEKYQHKIGASLENPVYLDLKLGNTCNIKCRTCSTNNSSKWASDEIKIHGKTFYFSLSNSWVDETSDFWIDLEKNLHSVEYFDFTGGEPFLIKKHFDILRKCVELGISKNISIHYNTNGTILPSDEILDIWKQFKWVEVMFSLDGVGSRFNYIRNTADWNTVERNFDILKSKDFLYVTVCHTVSILNIYYLPEFIAWVDSKSLARNKLYLNLVHSPKHYCIKNLSAIIKNKLSERLRSFNDSRIDPIVNFMMIDDEDLTDKFLEITETVDKVRTESFNETFEEFSLMFDRTKE